MVPATALVATAGYAETDIGLRRRMKDAAVMCEYGHDRTFTLGWRT